MNKEKISIEVYQQDWIPGFAAFSDDGQLEKDGHAHVMLNLGSVLCMLETKEIEANEIPYIVAECLMHEVIHVLEAWAKVEFSEDRVEKLIEEYRQKYKHNQIKAPTRAP